MPTPDAVLIHPAALPPEPMRPAMTAAIEALLGARRGGVAFGKDGHTGLIFGRPDPTATRLHPHGHPKALGERYLWRVGYAPDYAPCEECRPADCPEGAVLVGFLIDAPEGTPTDAA